MYDLASGLPLTVILVLWSQINRLVEWHPIEHFGELLILCFFLNAWGFPIENLILRFLHAWGQLLTHYMCRSGSLWAPLFNLTNSLDIEHLMT